MPTKRRRASGTWEFTVKRKGLLPKALSLTFDTEEEGDAYCAKLESMLDRGVVPPDLRQQAAASTLAGVIETYLHEKAVSQSDADLLPLMAKRLASVAPREVDYQWVEGWVAAMKREQKLSPSSIRHRVGALARCLDWAGKRHPEFVVNPVRLLPRGYATYSPGDAAAAGVDRGDEERERRLVGDEEERIRRVLAGETPEGRQRPLKATHRAALMLMFDLGLETGMRMRELYTIDVGQVDLAGRTIYLDKTKNGDKRQVPLSSVALRALREHKVPAAGLLLPFWDGDRSPKALRRTTMRVSQQWARVFDLAGCSDLHFHDLRHEATSRIFERTTLDPVSISRITGHRDPRMLRRYANLRASNLADALW